MKINLNFFKSKLAKDSLIYTVSDVINMALPFLLLPILARYLTPDDYGTLNAFSSIVAGISILVSLNVSAAINVMYYKLKKEELSIYIGNALMISLTSFIMILIIALIFRNYIEESLQISFIWILLGIILSFTNFITVINTNLWIMEQKPILFGGFKISNTVLNFGISLFLVVVLLLSWKGRALGIFISGIIYSIISLILLFKRGFLKFKFNLDYIKDALKFGIPLLPYQLSGWIRNGGIIFLLIYLVGKNETGLYSVGSKFALIIIVLSLAFSKAWGPYLYRELAKEITLKTKIKVVKVTYLVFIAYLLLSLLLTWVAPFLIEFVFPESYSESYKYVGYLVFGAAFQGMYLMVVKFIYFEKKTKYVAYITFVISIINFLLAFVLIKYNGSIGAAQATAISFFISFVLIWFYSNKVYDMPWNIFKKETVL